MSRRRSDPPLPILLLLAVGAVVFDRFRVSRLKPLWIAAPLLLCVILSTVGWQVAGHSREVSPPGSDGAAYVAPLAPTAAPALSPTTAPPAPTPTQPTPIAQPVRANQPNGATVPTIAPTVVPTAPPTAIPPAAPAAAGLPPGPGKPIGATTIPILMYHYIRVVNDPNDEIGIGLSVPPQTFAAQMQYLADKGYTTLTMAEVYRILNGELAMPPKPIALTFDDGYRDFYAVAWPILKQHNFKATSYIITSFIGWDAYMTWEMLFELDSSGLIEIGAHTRSHSDLRAQSNSRRWDEIIGSKTILETGLSHPIVSFCYPAGMYNASVVADVRRAGFLSATTVQPGTKQSVQNALEMPRIRVQGRASLREWISSLP